MLFANIALVDENFNVQPNCWVGTREGCIAYIGERPPRAEEAASFGEMYDGLGKLLMPALYNAHAHAPMTLLRGCAENLPLQRWLNEAVFPFEALMTEEDDFWGTLLACAEMARFGVVSYSDMYYHTPARARAVAKAHMKANLCEGLVAFEEKPYAEYPISGLMEQCVRDFHNTEDGRILIDYNIHSEYLSTEPVCRDILAIAKEKGLRLHIHLSETQREVEECKQRHGGMSPVQYFNNMRLFEVPVTAAHCVWLSEEDLDILQEHQVFVANNPSSNMKLGSGFAPIPEMYKRGIPVCLGSDGMASNNNHNLFRDMYLQAVIYKGATLDPTAVTPREALRSATRIGALSQGRTDCGLVKVGMKADLCVLDTTGPQWCPATDMIGNLVYAGQGSDVVLTMCDGDVIYEEGNWPYLDISRIKTECALRTARIREDLARTQAGV
jgi:5-methylthioadenosine/S-adenosylhomocysteine deaminase